MVYQIEIAGTGERFEARADESLLQAATSAGIAIPHDCQLGGCGTCRVKVVSGTHEYEEFPFGISQEEADAGFMLACQARASSDMVIAAVHVGGDASAPAEIEARVVDVSQLGPDVRRLAIELPEQVKLTFNPGQYMNVLLGDGERRSFSMASATAGPVLDFHIRRVPGGRFTDNMLSSLKAGDRLDVELPLGSFRFHAEDYRPLLMVVTGTGLAPVKAILESLMDDPDCPPVWLYWGARTEADLYLHDEIQQWGARLYEFQYVPVLSRPGNGWAGRQGYVQHAVCEDFADLSEHSVYLCGSPAMINDARRHFLEKGASINHLYADSFTFQHDAEALANTRA
ncbi:2Fe-2S iron-sulfur cluster-binding protein [Paraburkholderia silvatlantica]|uniref:CDP-4-dehydro-6-deoxyglucose reductase n=1 Tax=Paraburkholderia silvatlantica TaxID=321895 RepID=A0A2U1ABK0_9BURK|nr:2Fe-2S iron-sulfur cluster-binding protein [Paraburkholderia silvatlantica]MBB2930322.1 CDP-4-dehydro-6-deoxyglucose reductase [Paraburkholderia silvatlantica]PVY32152.1 CDP-4-dehydro-6-deoxyglucose reductase [Paraburkholderia silvatlantica]PXW37772.1 CDP-4-dehydro-6-deoxyglucose reductase [Paraburkholderia silvatlantica]PYE25593.1 CDP-4-dehydro-6-deoxyglucose reductase [Paraburkholderia silvatlantica]TDQ97764.1 CDP-4-dehydro-6-deoxyglucose reductase [Paraburkholderia silvatlantica]